MLCTPSAIGALEHRSARRGQSVSTVSALRQPRAAASVRVPVQKDNRACESSHLVDGFDRGCGGV